MLRVLQTLQLTFLVFQAGMFRKVNITIGV